jgi:hypothetical protein
MGHAYNLRLAPTQSVLHMSSLTELINLTTWNFQFSNTELQNQRAYRYAIEWARSTISGFKTSWHLVDICWWVVPMGAWKRWHVHLPSPFPVTLTYLVWCSTLNKVKHRDSNYFLGLTAFNQVPGQNCNESLLSSDRITMGLFIMWEQQSLSKLILRYSAPHCFGHTSYWYWLQYYSSRFKIICLLQYRSLS